MVIVKSKNIVVIKVFQILLILFGLMLLFQIIKKMLGGSWTVEDIILGLLVLNLGSVFTIGLMLAQLKSDHSHLKGQFRNLASDFKSSKNERNDDSS